MRHDQTVKSYLTNVVRSVDGMAWIACSVFSLIAAFLISFDLIPWVVEKHTKKVIVFLFMPLILFLILTNLRLLPFAGKKYAVLFRSLFILVAFILFNF